MNDYVTVLHDNYLFSNTKIITFMILVFFIVLFYYYIVVMELTDENYTVKIQDNRAIFLLIKYILAIQVKLLKFVMIIY